MARFNSNNILTCSFCNKKESSERFIVPGPGNVCICDQCIELCDTYIKTYNKTKKKSLMIESIPTPLEFKKYLDEYVVGQEHAKKVLSVAVYNHYKRIFHLSKNESGVVIDKSNVLLLGPTGSGKTLLAKTIAQKMQVPFAIADATTLTEAGYVGEDVENILLKLIQNADGDISLAEHGIVFIDEIDKISRRSENVSITRDVSGEGVQQALLKIIEGTVASVPPQGGRKHPNQEMMKIDTSNILFICGGAFIGLDKIIEARISSNHIGFGSDIKKSFEKDLVKLYDNISPDDLVKFGLIPELIGRLPVKVALSELTEEDLVRILIEPKNAIVKQFQETFKFDDVCLTFDDEAISAIARQAIQQNTGARGLRAIVEKLMLDYMFDAPSIKGKKQINITKKMIEDISERPKITVISEKTA